MVQTITVRSDETAYVNTGTFSIPVGGEFPVSSELENKIQEISSAISAQGISELHSEKDTFREFEHTVKGGNVEQLSFGSTISVSDFDWIMQHVDANYSAWLQEQVNPSGLDEIADPQVV